MFLFIRPYVIFSLWLLALLLLALLLAQSPKAFGSPKLVVLVSVDQLSPGRLSADMPGGLGRLMREGRVYTNAKLDHGLTNTCPGHVAMSTGVNPGKAGIPGNSYIDHITGQQRYCVDDEDDAHRVFGAQFNRSPKSMTATTLGDWLKASSPVSRVFSVSGKDRSAITMAGKNPDGVYWYEKSVAKFTSSGYYGPLPDYVQVFNGDEFFVDGYAARFPKTWEHKPGSHRADDYAGE